MEEHMGLVGADSHDFFFEVVFGLIWDLQGLHLPMSNINIPLSFDWGVLPTQLFLKRHCSAGPCFARAVLCKSVARVGVLFLAIRTGHRWPSLLGLI